jgi:hypothetical protein
MWLGHFIIRNFAIQACHLLLGTESSQDGGDKKPVQNFGAGNLFQVYHSEDRQEVERITLKLILCEDESWMELTVVCVQCQALVLVVLNLRILYPERVNIRSTTQRHTRGILKRKKYLFVEVTIYEVSHYFVCSMGTHVST